MGRKSTYTEEFKSEAVELANRKGLSKAASELGISVGTLRKWKSDTVEPGTRSDSDLEKEINRLRKENEYLRKINDVLKKSTAIFSQDHHPNSKS